MKFNKNDEYYTLIETAEYIIDFLGITQHCTVWCPFDDESSAFVKVLHDRNIKVYYTHIKNGQDFLNFTPNFHYDIVISNPPFSLKTKIIKKLGNIPYCLLFGLQSLSVSSFVKALNCDYWEIHVPEKRVKYRDIDGNIKTPSFQSCLIANFRMRG